MAKATKKDLREKLDELGVKYPASATLPQLQKLVDENSKEDEPENEDRISSDDEPSNESEEGQDQEEPRIKDETKEESFESDGDTGEDYLRQYQYRKQTVPGSKESDPASGSKAETMKRSLLSQPRVRMFIPREPKENPSIKLSVNLNGYRLDLPKQTYINVPEQIARVIQESFEQTEVAIDRGKISGDKEREDALT